MAKENSKISLLVASKDLRKDISPRTEKHNPRNSRNTA